VNPLKRLERQLSLLGGSALVLFGALVYLAVLDGALPGLDAWRDVPAQLGRQPLVTLPGMTKLPVFAAALALFVVAFAGLKVLRAKMRSLAQFEEATRRLASGDYGKRIHVPERDEFSTLARAFNALTDQLQESLSASQSLADIDRLILSSADRDTILRRVLISARMEALRVTLLLRPDTESTALQELAVERNRLVIRAVTGNGISEDSLRDVDGYRQVARRLCGEELRDCLPIVSESQITGVLVAAGNRDLTGNEDKRLTDLVDRLSVAITNIRRSESLYQQAHFDALTGLLNRRAFEDRLRESIARSARSERGVLLFIDLDGFKKVNDTEGHDAGDRLLVMISERIRTTLRQEDTIARLGGDEFAIIVPGCGDDKDVTHLCERLIETITQPLVVDRMEHSVGASLGVAIYPDDGQRLEELVMKADSAMYRAKEAGGSKFAFFDDTLNEASRHRVLVESRLRNAVRQRGLSVHFQPKLDLASWSVTSAEALLRWHDDKLGLVSPDMFVTIAEETSLVHEFMAILVHHTAGLLASTDAEGLELERVAINASPKQLMADGFALSLLSLLDQRGIPHPSIELEVTESVFARDTQQVVKELEILRNAGMNVALDDFGTGYSSLNMLRELPLDEVKIDRTFITELESSEQARALVQHIISISSTLNMRVVAEGVETERQLEILQAARCNTIQGWLIAKALPELDFVEFLKDWQHGEGAQLMPQLAVSARPAARSGESLSAH